MMVFATLLVSLITSIQTPPMFSPPDQETESKIQGHANVEVFGDVGWLGPSQTASIIVLITPETGWHVYWKNPGASGAPTIIEIKAPEGYTIGEPIFPRPSTFRGPEGPTYGYSKPVAIFVPVTAPDTVDNGRVEFQVTTSWLACKKICVMGEKEICFTYSVNAMQQGPLLRDKRTSRWAQLLPREITDLENGDCRIIGNLLHILGKSDLLPVRFIGIDKLGIQFGSPVYSNTVDEDGVFRLTIPLSLDYSPVDGESLTVEGLLLLGRKSEDPSYKVRVVATEGGEFSEHTGD